MSTTLLNRRFIRYVMQARTDEPVSITAIPSAVRQAYDHLLDTPWVRVSEKNATIPRHNWAQTGHSNNYDAYKFCGDYANGSQHAYAGAVCYTYRVPAAAITAGSTIEKVTIPAYGDRWLAGGVTIRMYTSISEFPQYLLHTTAPWPTTITGQMSVTPSNTGSDTAASLEITPVTPPTASTYIHIVMYLTNYLNYRGAWIEGGASIDGFNVQFQFNTDSLTADTSLYFDPQDSQVFAYLAMNPSTAGTVAPIRAAYPSLSHGYTTAALALRCWKGAIINAKASPWTDVGVVSSTQGAYVIRPTGENFAYAQGWYHAYGTSYIGTVRHLNLAVEMIPTTGVNVRLVVYAIPNSYLSTPLRWLKTIKSTTLSLPSFWNGSATSVIEDEGTVTLNCTAVLNTVLPGGITVASTHMWPINYLMTGPTSFLVVMSVDSVTASPGTTELATYGLVYTPATTAYLYKE